MKKEASSEFEPKVEVNKSEIEDAQEINKPTQEEVDEVEKEYNQAIEDWKVTTFDLSPAAEVGQNFINYIKKYMQTRMMWTQNAWMGAIKLEEELGQTEAVYIKHSKRQPPKVGYQALEFIVYILNNPGGVGLASAKEFEAEAEQHVMVLEHMEAQLTEARKTLDHIKYLQDKWAAYSQGFYYEKEPTDEEMEGAYFDDTLGRYVRPGEKEYDIQTFVEKVKEEYGEETANEVMEKMQAEAGVESIGPEIEKPNQ